MTAVQYEEAELQQAIEEFYAGQVIPGTGYTAHEDKVAMQTVLKDTPQSKGYRDIARALYTCRPHAAEGSNIMILYLDGILCLLDAFRVDPRFCEQEFMDMAAVAYDNNGLLYLLPF